MGDCVPFTTPPWTKACPKTNCERGWQWIKKTVQHWLDVYDETNDVVAETKGGRPRSTSSTQDQKLVKFAEGHEEASSADTARSMKRKCGELSPRSVRRRLTEDSLQSLRPTFAPLLNKKCRKARLAWAKENKTTNWNTVLFSDESTFETNRKITRVWGRRGEVVARGTVKHPVKVQVWGCLTS